MAQCMHVFERDPNNGEVRCKICADLDDEMQLVNPAQSNKEKLDDFYKTQESFE